MKQEVRIILKPDVPKNQNGTFFENLMNAVFETEGYKDLVLNGEFTGLEMDLYGKHRNKNEKLLVECKAKKKSLSTEVRNFIANIFGLDLADHGYFVYTQELDHGAFGIKEAIESNPEKNKKVTFLGPKKIIQNLVDSRKISPFKLNVFDSHKNIEKLILAYTYYGVYYVAITYTGAEDKQFHVFDAINHNSINSVSRFPDVTDGKLVVDALASDISELKDLIYYEAYNQDDSLFNSSRLSLSLRPEFTVILDKVDSNFAHPSVDEIRLNDLFVKSDFKNIGDEVLSKSKINKIYKFDDVFDVENNLKIAVFGDSVSGKTSISRYVCKQLFFEDYIPVLLKGEYFNNNLRTGRIQYILNKRFQEQYIAESTLSSLDKSKVVLIIDDLHKSSQLESDYWARLVTKLEEFSDRIIIFSDYMSSLKVGLRKKNGKGPLFDDYLKLRLLQLGPKLRLELIEKWYSLGNSDFFDTNETLQALDNARRHIKTIIGKNYVPSYPFYILSALQALEAGNVNQGDYSVYGFYYELLIKNRLNEVLKDNSKLNLYLNYLSNFAYYLFEIRENSVGNEDFKEFHKKFESKIDYDFSVVESLRLLCNAKVLCYLDDGIRFQENYAFYYFIASYLSKSLGRTSNENKDLSRSEAQVIILKLIQRVYREENSSIVLFLTHLSNDGYVIDTLIDNAKVIFRDLEVCKLEEDTAFMNELVSELPSQILENKSIKEARKEDVELQDQKEVSERYDDEFDTSEPRQYNLDEDVNTIDYFAKLNLAFKTLDILGQIAKAYWGELGSDSKRTIVNETYSLGLRCLSSYYEVLSKSGDEIANIIIEDIKDARIANSFAVKKKVEEDVKAFVFRMGFLAVWGTTSRISNAVGDSKLINTYESVLSENDFNSYKIVDLAIRLNYTGKIPMQLVKRYKEEWKSNKLSLLMLNNLVINHLYLFETTIGEKQQVSDILGVSVSKQRLIDKKSVEKKRK